MGNVQAQEIGYRAVFFNNFSEKEEYPVEISLKHSIEQLEA